MEFEYKDLCLTELCDDFLSNGFHQFYTELQEEQMDFEPLVSSIPSWENQEIIAPIIVEDHDYHTKNLTWIDETNIDQLQFSYVINEEDEPSATLLDLDYILMDLPLDNNDNFFELPEKTPLCNDSCSFFLKESAENLKLPTLDLPNFKIEVIQEENVSKKTEAKNLTCDFEGCGKSYAKPTHLKAHLKRHLNEKPYICHWPECKWRFSRSDELARHRRSHLGIKPYSCCFCTKSFARSDHLTKHRRVHEKKFNAMCKQGERQQIVWPAVPRGRPGRKPKPKNGENNDENLKYFNSSEIITA